MCKPHLCALILSAGFSSRMGSFKPLMRIGDKTAIEHAVSAFKRAGVNDTRVVTGYRAGDVSGILHGKGVEVINNPHFIEGMFSSVKAGVASIDNDSEAFFMLPVDTPIIRPYTLNEIYACYKKTNKGIIYPVFNGKKGHPPLISTKYIRQIISYDGDGGLRGFLKKHYDDSFCLDVMDKGTVMDMDTPDEYTTLLNYYKTIHDTAEEYTAAGLEEGLEVNR